MAEDTSARGDEASESETDAPSTETESQEQSSADKHVSHQSYRKAVEEAKRERQQKRALEAKLKDFEDQRLSEQGNKDELIKSLRSKLDAEAKGKKEIYGAFARKSINAQLKSAALEAGCIDPDAVMSLSDLSTLEVDPNTFEADHDEIKEVISGLKKSKPYLFQKKGPTINAKLPAGAKLENGMPDLSKMSREEKQRLLMQLSRK
jgi:hypothetical protein